ncbi:hypothetical protein ACQ859_28640 [Roseateles chitinivorans]|uniref:hypothetical protein n=1 Tax=Roseateles chitinivorans TaxID=2917965 RepID=UPI003D67CD08
MKRIERVASVGDNSTMTRGAARLVLTATMVAVLAACGGGGGGDAGTPVVGPGNGTGGGTTTPTTPTIALALSSTTVTSSAPATASVTLKDASGAPLAGVVVAFAVTNSQGTPQPASALTDANGVAKTTLAPTTATAAGADTLTATAVVGSTTLSATAGFQLTATDVTITAFSADVTSLGAYGQTGLTVDLGGTSPATPVTVTLTSSCVSGAHATLTPASVSTSTGKATFTFRDNGCGSYQNSDTLQATVSGSAVSRSLTLPVVAPTVASVTFADATPPTIYLKGSGAVENSNVTFRIVDANGNGVPNQTVNLTATTWAGGLTLDGVTNQTITRTSDSNGAVIVRVNSGTVPTPVRVRAALVNTPAVQAVSSALSIAVGLPSQLNFSLAQGAANIEGANFDGTPNTYTVTVSDRMGNPVPDDTAVNFVAEGGQINASAKTAKNAAGIATATANFVSSEPRPADGRVTVTAYALGEESFIDQNGNNIFDAGEPYQDLGDIYVDRLFNNFYNSNSDQLISASLGASLACSAWATEPGASLLQLNASIPSKPGSCDQAWGRAYVRRAVTTVFSTSGALPVFTMNDAKKVVGDGSPATCVYRNLIDFSYVLGSDENGAASTWLGYSPEATPRKNLVNYLAMGAGTHYAGNSTVGTLNFYVADSNSTAFNPMPAGTKITAKASTGITVEVLGGTPLISTTDPTLASVSYTFATGTSAGTVTVNFESPKGTVSGVTQKVSVGSPAVGTACSN